ncbi:D-serine ammonia-lyase [Clostridiisalibacter paucivorans]|uniref:D-serine ammonia-lyase n=1 Tax=Clostridiisalibacter paucivorans TaxID=408753 RepID=UPI00047A6BD4|nr:D-serine ammonia-lyase [Clostridiisalibacter paucivorans]
MDDNNILQCIVDYEPVFWSNQRENLISDIDITMEDIIDAEKRLQRFAPLIDRLFPETCGGIIESPLVKGESLKDELEKVYDTKVCGEFLLKCDSHLKVAGSIKARGGIYEVLKHAEKIAMDQKMLSKDDDYSKLANKEYRDLFSKYKIGVGSTGNLGLSIGIISSSLGFDVTVHMSSDAKKWKKDMLRNKGAKVVEYEDDYTKAVEEGRKQCEIDSMAYFVDDENSKDLFLGYSVAALRLKNQLEEMGIKVSREHPINVYLPCGVGGAPGGIAFGLRNVFKDNLYCYFVEPTHAPCMLLGLVTGKKSSISVKDYGIDNITEADGLAVGSPSKLVSNIADKLIDGIYTIDDEELFKLLYITKETMDIKIEPSAASSLKGPIAVKEKSRGIHIAWLTGGAFLPEKEYIKMYNRGKGLK